MKPLPERRITDVVDGSAPTDMTALVVDDESSYRTYIRSLAEKVGFIVDEAADGHTALEKLSQITFDVLIVNVDTPGIEGLERRPLRRIRPRRRRPAGLLRKRSAQPLEQCEHFGRPRLVGHFRELPGGRRAEDSGAN